MSSEVTENLAGLREGQEEITVIHPLLKITQSKRGKKSSASSRLQITERDIDILRFINDFGFCEMPHLDKRFWWHKPRNYQVIERLLRMGLLKHERVFYGRPGIYRLTLKGGALYRLACDAAGALG